MDIYNIKETRKFRVHKKVHAKSIGLRDNHYPPNLVFKSKRYLKTSPLYWQPNETSEKFSELVKFFEDLDFFEYTGETSIIVNDAN